MKKIISASGSPWCQQSLRKLGIPYEVVLKSVEETYPVHLRREQITDYLAEPGAIPFEGEIPPSCVLLTSDVLVWHEGKALGKPKDAADASAVLCSLSGRTHEVITLVCFTTNDAQGTHHCVTKVTFRGPIDKEIARYIEKYKPFDRTGVYGVQERIGHTRVTPIESSYNSVMGLPTHLICQLVN